MPIYEYRCQDCGTRFEKLVRGESESAGAACPSCNGNRLRMEISLFAAHSGGKSGAQPVCPRGGPCPTPGACGLN